MRFEMVFQTYIEVFNRLFSIRVDSSDMLFKYKKTKASTLLYLGPLHLAYTNQNKLHDALKDLIEQIDLDFQNYQVNNIDPSMTLDDTKPQNTLIN